MNIWIISIEAKKCECYNLNAMIWCRLEGIMINLKVICMVIVSPMWCKFREELTSL